MEMELSWQMEMEGTLWTLRSEEKVQVFKMFHSQVESPSAVWYARWRGQTVSEGAVLMALHNN